MADITILLEFFDEIEEIVTRMSVSHSQLESVMNEEGLRELQLQAEKLKDIVSVEDLLLGYGDTLIESSAGIVRGIQNSIDECHRNCLREPCIVVVSEEHLSLLLEHHFTETAIAKLFNVSLRTIRRKITEYGLDNQASYSDINDSELDMFTQQFVIMHPFSGQRSLERYLRLTNSASQTSEQSNEG